MLNRRELLCGAGAVGWAAVARGAFGFGMGGAQEAFAELEAEARGRLGLFYLGGGTGRQDGHRQDGYRADERFPMCSTFKFLLAGAVLRRVEEGKEKLGRVVRYGKADLLSYAPLTAPKVNRGMPVGELCAAAVTMSDNTAANVLLREIGGPGAVTAFARSIGDTVTRLDRNEPDLNEGVPGDPRDTTTPRAIAEDMERLVLGDVLSGNSRELLTGWLVGCKTGDKRIRAGLPAGWRVGDKTGTGPRGSTNDVAVIWPTGKPPVVIAVYLTGATVDDAAREAVLARAGRLGLTVLGLDGTGFR